MLTLIVLVVTTVAAIVVVTGIRSPGQNDTPHKLSGVTPVTGHPDTALSGEPGDSCVTRSTREP